MEHSTCNTHPTNQQSPELTNMNYRAYDIPIFRFPRFENITSEEPPTQHKLTKERICSLFKKVPTFPFTLEDFKEIRQIYSSKSIIPEVLQGFPYPPNNKLLFKRNNFYSTKAGHSYNCREENKATFSEPDFKSNTLLDIFKHVDSENDKDVAGSKNNPKAIIELIDVEEDFRKDLFKFDAGDQSSDNTIDYKVIEAAIIKGKENKREGHAKLFEPNIENFFRQPFKQAKESTPKQRLAESFSLNKKADEEQKSIKVEVKADKETQTDEIGNLFCSPSFNVKNMDRVWYYEDKGNLQGPYSSVEMLYLYENEVIIQSTIIKYGDLIMVVKDLENKVN